MLVVNFGHPLSGAQLEQIQAMIDPQRITAVKDIRVQVDQGMSFADQAFEIVGRVGWSSRQWQNTPFLLVPPGLSSIALAICAVIHGRAGYFPPIIRLAPTGGMPPVFVVAELLSLGVLRDDARASR